MTGKTLAIEAVFLFGNYSAAVSGPGGRLRAEWPPDWFRCFCAMQSAYHDAFDPDPGEQSALKALQKAGPPDILASPAVFRTTPTFFVPTNDHEYLPSMKNEMQILLEADTKHREQRTPESSIEREEALLAAREKASKIAAKKPRKPSQECKDTMAGMFPVKQPRTFPVAVPKVDRVRFEFHDVNFSEKHVRTIDALASRVSRIGNSRSMVSLRVVDDDIPEGLIRYRPDDSGETKMRVPLPDQMEKNMRSYLARNSEGDTPQPYRLDSMHQRYAKQSSFPVDVPVLREYSKWAAKDWVVLRTVPANGSRKPQGTCGEALAEALRGRIIKCNSGMPESLSGHISPTNHKSGKFHLAYVPLPFVGHKHATGEIQGIALLLPKDIDAAEKETFYRVVAQALKEDEGSIRLWGNNLSGVILEYVDIPDNDRPHTLRESRWTKPSTRWASVTPFPLHKQPKRRPGQGTQETQKKTDRQITETISDMFEFAGFPRPTGVEYHTKVPTPHGAPAAGGLIHLKHGKVKAKRAFHAVVTFDQAIDGPVIIGECCHRGVGLFLPMEP